MKIDQIPIEQFLFVLVDEQNKSLDCYFNYIIQF